jgi:uncharacterized protein (DUF1499 family)
MRALLNVLGRTPRLRILERDDVAVHAIARTAILRVPVDLEAIVDEARGRLDLRVSTRLALRERSSSRVYALELMQRIEAELRAVR